jgi:hypothetical protein
MEKGEPTMSWVEPTADAAFFYFFKEIYCPESIYSVYNKLQN